MQDISEENICNIENEINNIIIRSNSQEDHSIYVEIEIETACTVFEKREILLIQDLYSPLVNLNFSQKRINTTTDKILKQKDFSVTSKTNIADLQDGNLLDVEVDSIINKEQVTDSSVMYEGEMILNFIFENANNNVNSKISKIPFEFNIENPMQNENANVETKMNITNKKFNVKQNGDVDCNIDVDVLSEFSENVNMNIIDDIKIEELTKSSEDYDSLIIYIVQKDDTLWNIAKKFKSTVEDISRLNGIEDNNTIDIGQKLYIPKLQYAKR